MILSELSVADYTDTAKECQTASVPDMPKAIVAVLISVSPRYIRIWNKIRATAPIGNDTI